VFLLPNSQQHAFQFPNNLTQNIQLKPERFSSIDRLMKPPTPNPQSSTQFMTTSVLAQTKKKEVMKLNKNIVLLQEKKTARIKSVMFIHFQHLFSAQC